MANLSMFAGFLLAIVFLVSAFGKLRDQNGARHAMRDFGVPAALVPAAAIMLPIGELVVAGLLVPVRTAPVGALGALALLGIFIIAIGWNMAQGRHPDCHCFGQLHSAPAGWTTIVRNGLLLVPALVILFGNAFERMAGPVFDGTRADLAGAGILTQVALFWTLGALVTVAGFALNQTVEDNRVMSQLATLSATLELREHPGDPTFNLSREVVPRELPIGTRAPSFALRDLDGTMVSLDAMLSPGNPVLLVFADPICGPCGQLLQELPTWMQNYASALDIVVISRGDAASNRAKPGMLAMRRVLLQHDRELAWAYGIQGTPSAVLINRDGTIGSPVAGGVQPVRTLLASLAPSAALGASP